ncbi:MAG: hypothetical protein ACYC9L_07735 [Sulfuricaulis sp.]
MPNTDRSPQQYAEPAVIAAVPSSSNRTIAGLRSFFNAARILHQREKIRIRQEIAQIPGLLALLMKPRNGQKWTKDERRELRGQLRRLSRLGLYLAAAALPFTTLTLPLLAWWLDLRQRQRENNRSSNATE